MRDIGEQPVWLKDEIQQRLAADQSLPDDLREAAIAVTRTLPEDSDVLSTRCWLAVREPGGTAADHAQALRDAEQAVKLAADSGPILNTLGVAQYRAGQFAAAQETLFRSLDLNRNPESGPDPAFLALACFRLGDRTEAVSHLARLRERMRASNASRDRVTQGFLTEAETLIRSPP